MRLRPLSRDEVRAIDRRAVEEFGMPGVLLMENAGRGAATFLAELAGEGPIVLCCGGGNNGGDGYVMARHLDSWAYRVHVLVVADPARLTGDALVNFRIVEAAGIPITRWDGATAEGEAARALRDAAWIVDGLLGTGVRGEVTGPVRSALELLNSCPALKLAIDIPSGLDCDTGRPLGVALRASHTATFVSDKIGFAKPGASAYTGGVRVIEIGVPRRLLEEFAADA